MSLSLAGRTATVPLRLQSVVTGSCTAGANPTILGDICRNPRQLGNVGRWFPAGIIMGREGSEGPRHEMSWPPQDFVVGSCDPELLEPAAEGEEE